MPTPRKKGKVDRRRGARADTIRRTEQVRKLLAKNVSHVDIIEIIRETWGCGAQTAQLTITKVLDQWRATIEEPHAASLARYLAQLDEVHQLALDQGNVPEARQCVMAKAKLHGLVDDRARVAIVNSGTIAPTTADHLSSLPSAPLRGRLEVLLERARLGGAPLVPRPPEGGATAPRDREPAAASTPDPEPEPEPRRPGVIDAVSHERPAAH